MERGLIEMTESANLRQCDPEAALQRLGGLQSLYRDVVRNFIADSRDVLIRLQAATVAADGSTLHRVAHNFKGNAGLCGAVRVAEICGQLEKIGLEFDAIHAAEANRLLAAAIAVAGKELHGYLD